MTTHYNCLFLGLLFSWFSVLSKSLLSVLFHRPQEVEHCILLQLTFKTPEIRSWNLKKGEMVSLWFVCLCVFVSLRAPLTLKFANTELPHKHACILMHTHTHTRIYIASPDRYTVTFPTVTSSVSRETSSLSWYTSRKWIFNPAPPGGYLRKGFNWFKTNNYEPYFPAKSIFIHGCLHSEAVVLGWLGCTPPSLPAGPREGPAVRLSLHLRPEGGWCLPLPARLWCTSIGCVAMQEVVPGSQWPHTAHLFISSCIQYGINTSSSGKASTLFNPPLPCQNSSLPLFLLFLLSVFIYFSSSFHLSVCPGSYPALPSAHHIHIPFCYLYVSLIRHENSWNISYCCKYCKWILMVLLY